MTSIFGFSWPQLGKIGVVLSAVAGGAFGVGSFATDHHAQNTRLTTAETTIAATETHLAALDERTKGMKEHLGNIQNDLRALRELVEGAIRYSRFIPPKDPSHDRDRALRDTPKPGN